LDGPAPCLAGGKGISPGAPGYELLLAVLCAPGSLWKSYSHEPVVAVLRTTIRSGPATEATVIVTDPSERRLLAAYVDWQTEADLRIAPTQGQPQTEAFLDGVGLMGLHPTPQGLRVWNPLARGYVQVGYLTGR
jgi:hypothetical protein